LRRNSLKAQACPRLRHSGHVQRSPSDAARDTTEACLASHSPKTAQKKRLSENDFLRRRGAPGGWGRRPPRAWAGRKERHHFSMPWFERASAAEPPFFLPFSLPSFLALLHKERVSLGPLVVDQRHRRGVKVFQGLQRLRAEHEGPFFAQSRCASPASSQADKRWAGLCGAWRPSPSNLYSRNDQTGRRSPSCSANFLLAGREGWLACMGRCA